jgi:hypothetical protein
MRRGTNAIPLQQNADESLVRLAAARALYSRAKLILIMSLCVSVLVPASFSVATTQWAWLKPFSAAWGVFVAFLNVFLDRLQSAAIGRAALVQEKFDCELFGLSWNPTRSEPLPEDVATYGMGLLRSPAGQSLRDWYPSSVGNVPIRFGRLICQRINCTWERGLRTTYANAMLSLLLFLSFLVLALGTSLLHDFTDFVLVVLAPLTPASILLVRQHMDHRDAGQKSERLAEAATSMLRKAIQNAREDDSMDVDARVLQDAIFERRRSAPLVFDWIYRRLRARSDTSTGAGVEHLAREVLAALTREGYSADSGIQQAPASTEPPHD